jgi:VanZ family protein
VALIAYGSSRPNLDIRTFTFRGADKVAHASEYGVLGGLITRAFAPPPAAVAASAAVGAWAVATGLGAADEVFQESVPGREPSVLDALADSTGALLGMLVVRWWRGRRARSRKSPEPEEGG